MGIDACIYFEKVGELDYLHLPQNCSVSELSEWGLKECEGATHSLNLPDRWYWDGYTRGHFPRIANCLLSLYGCPGVGKVWYFPDNYQHEYWESSMFNDFLFSPKDFLQLCGFYLKLNTLD